LGFNLFYGNYAHDDEANFIRAGVDFMANCVMGGAHQMDLRTECDWSDPYVIRGGTRRAARRAFIDRTRPNILGIHFYDEPGLTWGNDPETGQWTPHAVPWQVRSFTAAFGQSPLDWKRVDPANPDHAAQWGQWARWKLGLMDAAWKDAQYGVSSVRPDYISVTQSQYGYGAFTDGYYYTVVRSLPVISGHGGYHDFGPGYFNPSLFLEFARARDLARPNWYLPTWYSSTTTDEFRLEQYLSFQCNLQGLMSPPDIEPAQPAKSLPAQGVVESNHLLARLGPIFTTMPVTRPPVALLFSLSQMVHAQTQDRKVNYVHETAHGRNVAFTYLAGKLLQHQFMPVLDEDILDGTLAGQHKAVILTSLDYLDALVIAALEAFAQQGGLVLLTSDCAVKIGGAINLGIAPRFPDAERIAQLARAGNNQEAARLMRLRHYLAGAKMLADAIRPHLERVGLLPPLTSNMPGIAVTRQAVGDVEYLFAVNATHDSQGDAMLGMKAVTATLGLVDDGRLVYDAVRGGVVKEFVKQGDRLQGQFRFGPGQMRVFARATQPIGRVRVARPALRRDFTLREAPIQIEVGAAVLDANGGILSGSVSLQIQVIDPLGGIRYDLYRATDRGLLSLSLPLALNDPPGQWRVTVTELLNHTKDTATFGFDPTPTCSAAAGSTWRAVHWPQDRQNIFRFSRTHQDVTIVKGAADYNNAAAERLAKVLEPWNVRCAMVNATEVNKPRRLSEDQAITWVGLDFAGKGQIKPGDQNPPALVGFAIQGPVILLGTPEDNPLIKFLFDQRFLPFQPVKGEMPGPRRGYVAWQREGVGVNQESITLIAHDTQGMSEAIGTMYEMLAGLEPLAPLILPRQSAITAASRAQVVPELAVEWSLALSDRIVGINAAGDKLKALSHAGELIELTSTGKVLSHQVVEGPAYQQATLELRSPSDPTAVAQAQKQAVPQRLVKFVAADMNQTAVAYWGGTLRLFANGAFQAANFFPQDLTALAWADSRLVAGDADGRIVALKTR
jgi:hypothetical protein